MNCLEGGKEMIPKIIHFCWFGGADLPRLAKKCIYSWKKFFPDYRIIKWDESNFDINCCNYVREAYDKKKWAFVSDYVRLYVLYKYGGIYFDTDVEVIKDFTPILRNGAFMGRELDYSDGLKNSYLVNPGLGVGVEKHNSIIYDVLKSYDRDHFVLSDGEENKKTIVDRTTRIMIQNGYDVNDNGVIRLKGLIVYPTAFFCPKNYLTGEVSVSSNTFSIHHYDASWLSKPQKIINQINYSFYRAGFGRSILKKIIIAPLIFLEDIRLKGFRGGVNLFLSQLNQKED